MAPERPQSVAVFELTLKNDKLQGLKVYYEANERFRVNWYAQRQPEGYRSIHGGVAYYCLYEDNRPTDKEASIRPVSEPAVSVDNSCYLWSEGDFEPGKPALMMILILPRKYTLVIPKDPKDPREKKPLGAKLFNGRLAVYWIPIADSEYRADIVWATKPFEGDMTSEVQRINKARAELPTSSPVDLDKEELPSWFTIAGVVFGALTLLFLMSLIILSLFSIEIPTTSRFIFVAFLALSIGLSSTFLGGTAAARGSISLPFFKESPMVFGVTGGIAVFIIVLVLGSVLYVM